MRDVLGHAIICELAFGSVNELVVPCRGHWRVDVKTRHDEANPETIGLLDPA